MRENLSRLSAEGTIISYSAVPIAAESRQCQQRRRCTILTPAVFLLLAADEGGNLRRPGEASGAVSDPGDPPGLGSSPGPGAQQHEAGHGRQRPQAEVGSSHRQDHVAMQGRLYWTYSSTAWN